MGNIVRVEGAHAPGRVPRPALPITSEWPIFCVLCKGWVQPELLGGAEVAGQTSGHLGSDGAVFANGRINCNNKLKAG